VFDDGSVKHIYGYASPLFDEDGAIRGALAALMDISSRKETEAQLEEAHERNSAILESLTDAFYALDREWRYTYVNRQAELYYGVDRQSLLGRSIWEVFPVLLSSDSYTQYQRAMQDNVPVHFELHSPTTQRWIEIHAYPSPQGLSVFFRDIEGRKRSAQEVEFLNRELNGRVSELETLLELLPVGVWIGNATCDHLIGNRAAYEILGLPFGINASMTSSQATQPPLVYLKFTINGEPVSPEELPMHKAARTALPCENVEYELVRADGTVRSVYGSAAPLFDEDGRVRAVIGAHTDITDRKYIEVALRQADRRKDEFLATLAHELRNPLNPIRSALATLRMQSRPASGAQWPGEVIDRQVRQMARLLDDLLDVSRITLNRLELRREHTLLADIVAAAVETSGPLIEANGHQLEVALPAQPIHVDADGTRLSQVFSNLLNNAAKYTDRGGRIRISAKADGGVVCIVVEDNGIGIAPERLAQVFDMFSQEQPALDRSHSGLGIGLALSRALVQMHGGNIEAHSAGRGRGSRFTVLLPIVESKSAAPYDVILATGDGNGGARRILVVDDNRDSAESLALYLELLGHTVRMAHDGIEAVSAAAALRPDAVLLDIGLPGQNGYEVARSLRGTAWGRDLLLVAITGWGQEEDKRRARESGFDIHLTKPVDPRTVVDLLQSAPTHH
jgi:PAS domain S-box-containing protein